jgi:Bacterial SH3 domain
MTTIGTVKSPGLNVRARPALHAKKLDALGRGDEVEILDRAAPYGYAWLKVKARNTGMGSGVTGWVYAADIDIAPPVPPDVTPPEPAPEPPSPAPATARAPRAFLFAAGALAAGVVLIAWLLG